MGLWQHERGSIIGGACWLAIGSLLAISGAMAIGSLTETRGADRRYITEQAGQLAEAGLDYAVKQLGDSQVNWAAWPATTSGATTQSYADGRFTVTVDPVADGMRRIKAAGEVMRDGAVVGTWTVCAHARRWLPSDFYDYALISAQDVTLDGTVVVTGGELNNDLTGKGILYGESLTTNGTAVVVTDPSPTKDPSINPLPLLDLDWLRAKARAQGNYYDADRLAAVAQKQDAFPALFYYQLPTVNPLSGQIITPGVPNVVFVEGDLTLTGNTVVGGFFVVANTANADAEEDVTNEIGSRGTTVVDGVIYSLRNVKIAGNAAISGAVWGARDVTVRGNAAVTYNSVFADAIQIMNPPPAIQVMGYHRCD